VLCCTGLALLALQELESHVTPLNAEYWGCLLTLADHEVEALKLRDEADKAAGGSHYQQQQQMQQQRQYGGYGSGGYGGGRGYGGFGGGAYGAAAAAAAAAADLPPPRAIGAPLEGHGPGGVHSAVQREIETLLSGALAQLASFCLILSDFCLVGVLMRCLVGQL
jgi:hypothetical protein